MIVHMFIYLIIIPFLKNVKPFRGKIKKRLIPIMASISLY